MNIGTHWIEAILKIEKVFGPSIELMTFPYKLAAMMLEQTIRHHTK